jgi:hypothetical protein
MSIKRLTKEEIQKSSGIFNPVGHVVLSFQDDGLALAAAKALRSDGFVEEDILAYQACDAVSRLRERVRTASQAAGFGHEITLMRRYLGLAETGAGWLIVFAQHDAAVRRIVEVATRYAALCAVRYHRLASEDLI